MKNKTYIFILVVLAVGGFFTTKKFISKESDAKPIVVEEPKSEDTKVDKIDTSKSEVVKNTSIQNQPLPTSNKLSLPPTLERPINITTSLSGAEKDEVIEEIKHFEASLKNKPQNMHEWIQLGNLRKIIGDYLGAVEYWKYASLLEPTFHVPYNNLGNLYQYYLNDMVKAEEYYKKYIELSPQTEEPYKLLFELYTLSYKEKENLAISVLEEGIKKTTYNDNLKRLLENYKKEKGDEEDQNNSF